MQVIALVQTAVTVAGGLDDRTVSGGLDHRSAATGYLVALVAGTALAILLGVGMLALIARAPKAGALLAFSIAAIAFSSWFAGLVFPIGTVVSSSPYADVMSGIARISPAVIIGAAIVWAGVSTVGRAIAGIVSLVLLVVGPVLVTAISSAAGSRVLLPYPAEMLDYGLSVFRSALGMPDIWGSTLAVALGVAVVGLVGRRSIAKAAA